MERESVALITGAGRGIGRATAVELGRRGYRLALAARTPGELEQTRKIAGDALLIPTDVSDARQVEDLLAKTLAHFSRIDALVHCAGVAPAVTVEKMTIDQWHQVINTNLSSAFYLAHAIWPIFRKQQSGVIVNLSSMASRDPFPGFAAYGAAKAALNVFSTVLAREGASIGVRVHTIAPGAVETSMFRALMAEEQWPTEKTLLPEDVAAVIAQCVTGELRYASGEVIFLSRTP